MKKAMVSLSFDDGREDNIRIAKDILLPRCLSATFNITTGYVDKTCPPAALKTEQQPMTVEDVRWLFQNDLFEIAMHGDKHLNTPDDILNGREKLLRWLSLPDVYKFGFASPSSGLDLDGLSADKLKLMNDNILYYRVGQRIGKGIKKVELLQKIDKKLNIGRFYNFYQPRAFAIENSDSFMNTVTDKMIYSAIVYRHTTCEEIECLIEKCIRKKQAIVLMLHSILDNAEQIKSNKKDNDLKYLWNKGKFIALCDYLSSRRESGKLNVVTTKELYESL